MKLRSCGVLLALVLSLRAQSQLGAGAVGGVVLDATGKSVSAAAVQVTGDDTGLSRQTVTSATGDFVIPVRPPGRYTLRVGKAGFSKLQQHNVTVTVGATVPLSLRLDVGVTSTQVEVTAEAAIIDTAKTTETLLIDREQIDNLPINGRRYDQFALLAPGVT